MKRVMVNTLEIKMNINQLKSDMSMVHRYLSMRMVEVYEEPYKFGENAVVDSFLFMIDPFVQTVSSQRITESDYWIHDVYPYTDGIILDVEVRFGSREKIDLPYTLLNGGIEGIPRYLKENEFYSVLGQIETVKEHITKCHGRLTVLETKLNTMAAELWPEVQ